MIEHRFAPGWRLSGFDAVILLLGIIGSFVLGFYVWWMALVVAFAVGHFFLFCNIVRMSRSLELVWATVFVALCAATILIEFPGWLWTAVFSIGLTFVLVMVEMRKPSYHGIGWQRINPNLREWWEKRFGGTERR